MIADAPPAFVAPALPDEALADMRGGFSIAGGPDISLAVTTQTALDGRLLLRSIYVVEGATPSLSVQAPAPGMPVVLGQGDMTTQGDAAGTAPGMTVSFDRQTGVSITPAAPFAGAPIMVSTGSADVSAGPAAPILDLSRGPVATDGGTVSLVPGELTTRVQLDGDRIAVSHLFGGAIGSVIANGGNDRAIESMTSVTLSLGGATPYNLGSASLRVEGLALDVTRALVVR